MMEKENGLEKVQLGTATNTTTENREKVSKGEREKESALLVTLITLVLSFVTLGTGRPFTVRW